MPVLLGGALLEGSGNEGVAFVLDLSEQERAERALRRSEEFLAEGERLGQIGSFAGRVATDEVTWSDQLYRIYGLEVGVPVTRDLIRSRVHPPLILFGAPIASAGDVPSIQSDSGSLPCLRRSAPLGPE